MLLRFGKFLGILTLESFAASALGLAVGSIAPSTEAALAMGPAVCSLCTQARSGMARCRLVTGAHMLHRVWQGLLPMQNCSSSFARCLR